MNKTLKIVFNLTVLFIYNELLDSKECGSEHFRKNCIGKHDGIQK